MNPKMVPAATEPELWTVVFHRKAQNWFFSAVAMGHFKHVSAFAWLPEMRVWLVYDVSFRCTRIVVLPDTPESKAMLAQVITGNAIVSIRRRDDALPIIRCGLFCTTAVKHLLGLSGGALRPDALFRLCVAQGGKVSDDASQENRPADGPGACERTGAGRGGEHHEPANAGSI